MKTMRKIFVAVLALAMIVAMALPVAADAGTDHKHTITINKAEAGNEYVAYQIFAGTVDAVNGDDILSDVSWGTGVDQNDLTQLYADLKSAAVNPDYYGLYTTADSAEGVSNALASKNESAHAAVFADIISKYLTDVVVSSNPVRDDQGNVTAYTISGLEDGYYLVKQTTVGDVYDTASEYILEVVKDVEAAAKDGTVTIDKYIVDGEDMVSAADYSIGDTVIMELHATLPMYYVNYETYYLEFYDTLSKGLTLDKNSIVVEIDNDASVVTVDPKWYTVSTSDYTGPDATKEGGTVLRVVFTDLKAITDVAINNDTKIYVTYNAEVNTAAEVGNPGNPNYVKLIFSNDPNTDGKGETPEEYVKVFTFELDTNKIDGEAKKALEGVKFKLYRKHTKGDEYAILNEEGRVTGWTTDKAEGTELVTDEAGNFKVIGLEASKYWLTETEALPGYDTIDDFAFTISATIDQTKQEVTMLTITRDNEQPANGNVDTGIVELQVVNNPGKELPSTGGMGTTLFYVVGGLMVAAALILLVTRKRMSFEA